MKNLKKRVCEYCGKRIQGRKDKRFCSATHKTEAFYKRKYQTHDNLTGPELDALNAEIRAASRKQKGAQ